MAGTCGAVGTRFRRRVGRGRRGGMSAEQYLVFAERAELYGKGPDSKRRTKAAAARIRRRRHQRRSDSRGTRP